MESGNRAGFRKGGGGFVFASGLAQTRRLMQSAIPRGLVL